MQEKVGECRRDGGEASTDKFQITLDSGASASCWLAEWMPEVPMKPQSLGVKFRKRRRVGVFRQEGHRLLSSEREQH